MQDLLNIFFSFVYIRIYTSVYLVDPIYLSVYLSVCLYPIYQSIYLPIIFNRKFVLDKNESKRQFWAENPPCTMTCPCCSPVPSSPGFSRQSRGIWGNSACSWNLAPIPTSLGGRIAELRAGMGFGWFEGMVLCELVIVCHSP